LVVALGLAWALVVVVVGDVVVVELVVPELVVVVVEPVLAVEDVLEVVEVVVVEGPSGVTALDAPETGPVPLSFVAETVKV
jgi:hypothetical protein